ncbi:hypothetical protein PIB30_049816 [Stylosanthes scabra]|uniref:Uncharacterized protein n=1 Tax=Stylosanthes scabra TaxID=79078 RepID=A0ABU6VKE5_9FABA|nr:hypothetical protein [Stylosanthes scabra]
MGGIGTFGYGLTPPLDLNSSAGKPSPLAKGKAKMHALPTRASPRLAAFRARLATASRPVAPVTSAVPAPPKARRTARISVKYYSRQLAERVVLQTLYPQIPTPLTSAVTQKQILDRVIQINKWLVWLKHKKRILKKIPRRIPRKRILKRIRKGIMKKGSWRSRWKKTLTRRE